jgi:subtilisin family serine protease
LKKKARYSSLFAAVLALLALSGVPEPGGAPQTMEYYVENGRLAQPVLDGVMRNGWTDALLLIRTADFSVMGAAAAGRGGGSLRDRARRYSARKAAILDRLFPDDVTLLQEYEHLPVAHLRANAQALQALLTDGEVIAVVENKRVYPALAQSLPLISADLAHLDGYTGENTSVAVIDTGVDYTHPAFGACTSPGQPVPSCKVAFAEDVAFDDRSRDDSGHGTHVAAIVLGTAPDTKIIALDVFSKQWNGPDDSEWVTSYSVILKAVDWVLSHHSDFAIAAVNLSLASRGTVSRYPCPNDGLAPAITEMRAAGILSAVAAGNDGSPFGIAYPACSPDAVSVGAVFDGESGTGVDRVADFSNSANYLTLLAPGLRSQPPA